MTLKIGTVGLPKDVVAGVATTITRDSLGRVSSFVEGGTTSTINRDSSGRITSVVLSGDITGTVTLSRDALNRISGITVS